MTAHTSRSTRSFIRYVIGAVCAMVLFAAATASAVTPKDLIELTRAGLSDDVLVGLIEADQGGVRLDAEQILMMRNAGVSERVILALLKEQRRQAEAAAALEPAPVLEPPPVEQPAPVTPVEQAPVVLQQQVPVAVPVLIPWTPVAPAFGVQQPTLSRPGFGRFINNGWVESRAPVSPVVVVPQRRHAR